MGESPGEGHSIEPSSEDDMQEEEDSHTASMADDIFSHSIIPGISSAALRTLHSWFRGEERQVDSDSPSLSHILNEEELVTHHHIGMNVNAGSNDPATSTSPLGSMHPSMQSFLRSFGFSATSVPGPNQGKFQQLLDGLRAQGDEDRQLTCLQELSELLSMSMEDAMGGFQSEQYVSILLTLLDYELNPNMMILACRCLYNLLEAWPPAGSHIVIQNGIAKLCSKLISIEYIDLAETAIETLERLSHQHGLTILRQNGLLAVLSFLEFFPTSIQRQSMNIVINSCRYVPSDLFPSVEESIPYLINLLQHPDSKVLERTCIALSRLTESFSREDEKLKVIASELLLNRFLEILRPPLKHHITALSVTTILKTLTMICRYEFTITFSLLSKSDLPKILAEHLSGTFIIHPKGIDRLSLSTPPLSSSPHYASLAKTHDQLSEILSLIQVLMPSLPTTGPFDERIIDINEGGIVGGGGDDLSDTAPPSSIPTTTPPPPVPSSMASMTTNPSTTATINPMIELLERNKMVMGDFSQLMIPILMDVYTSGMTMNVKQMCLISLMKSIYFTNDEELSQSLDDINISVFIAGLLSSLNEVILVIYGLQMTELLLLKLPAIFQPYFTREGVLHAILKIASMNHLFDLFKDQMILMSPTPIESQNDERIEMIRLTPEHMRILFPLFMLLPDKEKTPQLERWLRTKSRHLIATYFPSIGGSGISSTGSISGNLSKEDGKDETTDKNLSVWERLGRISRLLDGKEGEGIYLLAELLQEMDDLTAISSFELLESGLVDSLLGYLTIEGESFIHRIYTFMNCFMGYPIGGSNFYPDALLRFISKLHEALHRTEQFPLNVTMNVVFPMTTPLEAAYKSVSRPIKVNTITSSDADADGQVEVYVLPSCASFYSLERIMLHKIYKNTDKFIDKSDVNAMEIGNDQHVDTDLGDSGMTNVSHSDGEEEMDTRGSSDSEHAMVEVEMMDDDQDGRNTTSKMIDIEASSFQSSSSDPIKYLSSLENGSVHVKFTYNQQIMDENCTMYHAFQLKPQSYRQMIEFKIQCHIIQDHELPQETYSMLNRCENDVLQRWHKLIKEDGEYDGEDHPTNNINVLKLIRVLYKLMEGGYKLLQHIETRTDFQVRPDFLYSTQLNAKVLRQLQDPFTVLSGNIPSWVPFLLRNVRALFPVETRLLYLVETGMGVGRSLMALQESTKNDAAGHEHIRLPRNKVRLERDDDTLFLCGLRALQLYANTTAILDVSFINEVGFGTGPTQEFFTLMSRAFQEPRYQLFRHNESANSLSSEGLYPQPSIIHRIDKSKEFLFISLGRLIGKSLIDKRLLDLHFSGVFYQWLLGEQHQLSWMDLFMVDEKLFRSLIKLKEMGENVNELGIEFVLPGYDDRIELIPNGKNIHVTLSNVDDYIEKVANYTLYQGVYWQMNAVRKGLNDVFSIDSLKVLNANELHETIFGTKEVWTSFLLMDAIRVDHGYHKNSHAIGMLIDILCEMTGKEQAVFLQFVTGSPRLPMGGVRALKPPLTIVKRLGENPVQKADEQLPSAMTCANHLRLPDYSTKKTMKERLFYAMAEGCGAFLLS